MAGISSTHTHIYTPSSLALSISLSLLFLPLFMSLSHTHSLFLSLTLSLSVLSFFYLECFDVIMTARPTAFLLSYMCERNVLFVCMLSSCLCVCYPHVCVYAILMFVCVLSSCLCVCYPHVCVYAILMFVCVLSSYRPLASLERGRSSRGYALVIRHRFRGLRSRVRPRHQ